MAKHIDSLVVRNELTTHEEGLAVAYYEARDTTESAHDALCAMGWTPPGEKAEDDGFEDVQRKADEVYKALRERLIYGSVPRYYFGKCTTEPQRATEQVVKNAQVKTAMDAVVGTSPTPPVNKLIHEAFRTLTHAVHANAVEHGWWEEDRGTEPLLLMHAEISEAVEALREGNPESKKIPGHSHVAEELADVIIRVLDYCGKNNINIGAAITAKHEFNRSRPYRHGGKAF